MKNIKKMGFTLIELMVVISIIGTLSTITVSALNEAREDAKEKKFLVHLNTLRNAMELYHIDNGEYVSIDTPPTTHNYTGGGEYYKINSTEIWGKMTPYINIPGDLFPQENIPNYILYDSNPFSTNIDYFYIRPYHALGECSGGSDVGAAAATTADKYTIIYHSYGANESDPYYGGSWNYYAGDVHNYCIFSN